MAELLLGLRRDSGTIDKSLLNLVIRSINEEWYSFSQQDRQDFASAVRDLINDDCAKSKAAGLKAATAFENLDLKRLELLYKLLTEQKEQTNVTFNVTVAAEQQRAGLAALSNRLGLRTVDSPVQPGTTNVDP